jgi:hypothetical protein
MPAESALDQQLRVVVEVEYLMNRARAELDAGKDASLYLWLGRRALRAFGRRRAKKVAGQER